MNTPRNLSAAFHCIFHSSDLRNTFLRTILKTPRVFRSEGCRFESCPTARTLAPQYGDPHRDNHFVVVVIGFVEDALRIHHDFEVVLARWDACHVEPLTIERFIVNILPAARDSLVFTSVSLRWPSTAHVALVVSQ